MTTASLVAFFTAAAPIAITIAGVAAPMIMRSYLRTVKDEKRKSEIRRAVRGTYYVVAAIAKKTPTTLDDNLSSLLRAVVDEVGPMSPHEVDLARRVGVSMHTNPAFPDLTFEEDVGAVLPKRGLP